MTVATSAGRKQRDDATGSTGALVFNLGVLGFTLLLLAATRELQPSAAVVPRAVGLTLFALLSYRLVREIRARRRATAPKGEKPVGRPNEIAAVFWLLALPAVATLLGFVAGPAIWTVAWLRIRARESLPVAVAAGGFAVIVILALFAGLLETRLPHGIFEALR